MSTFTDMIEKDNETVFLNLEEFAERKTVIYQGKEYADVPVVMTGMRENRRGQTMRDGIRIRTADYASGLFETRTVLHMLASDLGNIQPEKGTLFSIRETDTYSRDYYVFESKIEKGMLRLDLEGIDE